MMEEGYEKKDRFEKHEKDEIFSKSVRAGKRTYFFDVKSTRRNDFYLTITESKKRFNKDGRFFYEKHKIFLYKEDFDKFTECLMEVVEYINNLKVDSSMQVNENEELEGNGYTNVEFEDLESVEASQDDQVEKE